MAESSGTKKMPEDDPEGSLAEALQWLKLGRDIQTTAGTNDSSTEAGNCFDRAAWILLTAASRLQTSDSFVSDISTLFGWRISGPGDGSNSEGDDELNALKSTIRHSGPLPAFDSLAYLTNAKSVLYEAVILPTKLPHLFTGIRQPWKGVLLYGPPGTGKTQLARAVAGESSAAFFCVTPAVLLSKYVGEAEKTTKSIFRLAKRDAPSIVFFDEVDALGCCRSSEGDPALRRVLAELLIQISGLRPSDRVIVLGATNRIDDVDPALLRRFERRLKVGMPSTKERQELLALKLTGLAMDINIDLRLLAKELEDFSGADVELFCRDAAMYPLRELAYGLSDLDDVDISKLEPRPICWSDFENAFQAIQPLGKRSHEKQHRRPMPADWVPQSGADMTDISHSPRSDAPKQQTKPITDQLTAMLPVNEIDPEHDSAIKISDAVLTPQSKRIRVRSHQSAEHECDGEDPCHVPSEEKGGAADSSCQATKTCDSDTDDMPDADTVIVCLGSEE